MLVGYYSHCSTKQTTDTRWRTIVYQLLWPGTVSSFPAWRWFLPLLQQNKIHEDNVVISEVANQVQILSNINKLSVHLIFLVSSTILLPIPTQQFMVSIYREKLYLETLYNSLHPFNPSRF